MSEAPVVVVAGVIAALSDAVVRSLAEEGYEVRRIFGAQPSDIGAAISSDPSPPTLDTLDMTSASAVVIVTSNGERAWAQDVHGGAPDSLDSDLLTTLVEQCVTLVCERLSRIGGGRLVLVGSVAGHVGADSLKVAAIDTALSGIVRSATARWASDHVAVNLVLSGILEDAESTGDAASTGPQHGARYESAWLARSALGRPVRLAEVAAAVTFLCGEDAGFCNGSTIPVDGGLSMGSA